MGQNSQKIVLILPKNFKVITDKKNVILFTMKKLKWLKQEKQEQHYFGIS